MSMLAGLRVVELSDGLVDFGGRMLAELGADVVAIDAGEGARAHAATLAWHHGKERLVADGGEAALAGLIARADILLDGRRVGAPGAAVEAAVAAREELIHVVASSFSVDGPHAGRPASDLTLMAQSGLMTITGEPDRPPLRLPGEQAYALTGIQAATAALLGIAARRATGKGQRIDVSALQSATLANYRSAVMYEWTGRIGTRTGNRLVRGKSGVRQVWPCRDGFVTWSMIDNPGMMRAVVRVMEAEGAAGKLAAIDWDAILVADLPQETIDDWQSVFAAFYSRHDRERLQAWSLENGWGLSAIETLDDVRESPQMTARGLFVAVADEEAGAPALLPGPLFAHEAGDEHPERALRKPVALSDFTRWSEA